jgi:lipopolysaccharide export LptBFGC system permease protein LptF
MRAEEVYNRLLNITSNELTSAQDRTILFSGFVKEDRFRISVKISRPNTYLTLIKGRIESTSSGCLIFLNYQLFPATKLFLTFGVLLTCFLAICVGFQYSSFWYGLAGLGVVIFIYLITWSNFKIQLKIAHTELLKVFE